jgi:hypothetical protein
MVHNNLSELRNATECARLSTATTFASYDQDASALCSTPAPKNVSGFR